MIVWKSAKKFYETYPAPGYVREAATALHALAGHMPSWSHDFVTLANGSRVAPDYFAIGTDKDFVRAPLTCYAAQYLADRWGFQFPLPDLVDEIWHAAAIKLGAYPQTWYEGYTQGIYNMRYGPNYVAHNQLLERDRGDRRGLVAGGKKDVVPAARGSRMLRIYGWQKPDGSVWQGPSSAHDVMWEDYAQGIRFCLPGSATGPAYADPMPAAFLQAMAVLSAQGI